MSEWTVKDVLNGIVCALIILGVLGLLAFSLSSLILDCRASMPAYELGERIAWQDSPFENYWRVYFSDDVQSKRKAYRSGLRDGFWKEYHEKVVKEHRSNED